MTRFLELWINYRAAFQAAGKCNYYNVSGLRRHLTVETGIYHLCFLAHYRHFRLHLIPHVELFSEDFHAYSVGENNEKIEIAVDKDSFYKGYDEGITLSSFTPVCDSQSNLILAQISNISLWHFFLQKQHCGLSKARFKQRLLIVNYKMIYSCITCKLFSF